MTTANNTKREFAIALKDLLRKEAFRKISIGDICGHCNKNRKSFYYYYKDKYDLANITFDEEFPFLRENATAENLGNTIKELCRYLYENRAYYKRLLEPDCQNSFSDHLRLELREYFSSCIAGSDLFACSFLADAVYFSIKEWILSKQSTHFSLYCNQLLQCVRTNTYKEH